MRPAAMQRIHFPRSRRVRFGLKARAAVGKITQKISRGNPGVNDLLTLRFQLYAEVRR